MTVTAILLVAIGLGAAYRATQVDSGRFLSDVEDVIGRMEQDDTTWTSNILRVQLGLVSNYDQLIAPAYQMQRHIAELERLTREIAMPGASLASLWPSRAELEVLVNKKADLAIRTAAHLAILCNSERYLLIAAEAVARLPESTGPQNDLRTDVARLTMLMTSHLLASPVEPISIMDESQELTRVASSLPAQTREIVRTFVLHATTIAQQRQSGSELLAQLGSLSAAPVAERMRHIYVEQRDRLAARQRTYRTLAVLLGVILVAQITVVLQLRRDYVRVSKANQTLKRDQVETQSLLVQTAKMSSLGEFVAGIAHEINTPLAYIRATMEMLDDMLGKTVRNSTNDRELAQALTKRNGGDGSTLFDDIHMLLDDGVHGVDRITELVRSLRNFSRRDHTEVHAVSLAELCESALVISSHQVKQVATVRREYSNVPKVCCSPSQIVQVLINLISNAAHAMRIRDGNGVLTIRIGLDRAAVARIDVMDNGAGILPDVLSHVFDPFFSTKSNGEGTGLGLSICDRIIKAHGGQILVDTDLGKGSTFSVLLPTRAIRSAESPVHVGVGVQQRG